jgi:hypothetical protein
MAAPHVTGAAALVWGQKQYAGLDHRQLKNLLLANVRKLDSLSDVCASGGTLNLAFLNAEPTKDKPQTLPAPSPPKIFYPFPPRPVISFRVRCGG